MEPNTNIGKVKFIEPLGYKESAHNTYATATILPAQEDKNQLSFGGSSLLGLGSSLLGGGGLQSSGIELITIMNSRTFSEDVIEHFNLLKYMEIDDTDTLIIREKAKI